MVPGLRRTTRIRPSISKLRSSAVRCCVSGPESEISPRAETSWRDSPSFSFSASDLVSAKHCRSRVALVPAWPGSHARFLIGRALFSFPCSAPGRADAHNRDRNNRGAAAVSPNRFAPFQSPSSRRRCRGRLRSGFAVIAIQCATGAHPLLGLTRSA